MTLTSITRRPANTMFTAFPNLLDVFQDDPFFQNFELKPNANGNLAVDVSEHDNQVIVRASLPGFRSEDIDAQVHDGVLTIKAERTETQESSSDEKYYHRERRFGSVARRIDLPGVVSDAEATAELKDGVLTVRIPQAPNARPKKIAIN